MPYVPLQERPPYLRRGHVNAHHRRPKAQLKYTVSHYITLRSETAAGGLGLFPTTIAAGPGRPSELNSWLGRPAMPTPGGPGQEWVCVRDRGLLRKWQRRHQRQR
ncbi:hypothetical protein QJQ45_001870 [Haematococcus lacustris]|nr:hypothetical protein QJQ45_001870 [Haematococcus lacustris]